MRFCDLTLPTTQQNLACDEALLDLCESRPGLELLRFWEPTQHCVVVGYANRAAIEVNLDFCRAHNIPVLRRCSGGGTVLQGSGCLNYTLILRTTEAQPRPQKESQFVAGIPGRHAGDTGLLPRQGGPAACALEPSPTRSITSTNNYVMGRHRAALAALLRASIEVRGHTDLAIGGMKFCGNAQRRKRNCLIFHGCFLLDLDLSFMEKALPMPSHQPDYRVNRRHSDFLLNLKIDPTAVKTTLTHTWAAEEPFDLDPLLLEGVERLVTEKYGRDDWNLKF